MVVVVVEVGGCSNITSAGRFKSRVGCSALLLRREETACAEATVSWSHASQPVKPCKGLGPEKTALSPCLLAGNHDVLAGPAQLSAAASTAGDSTRLQLWGPAHAWMPAWSWHLLVVRQTTSGCQQWWHQSSQRMGWTCAACLAPAQCCTK